MKQLSAEEKQKRLGTENIPKLVMAMSLPAMVSMLVQALYNIIDSIFVAQINEAALTAVSLAFPIQMIIIAIVVGLGIGINSLISRNIGSGDMEAASNAAEHGYLAAGLIYLVLVIIGITLPRTFFGIFTSDPLIIDYATTYITIVMIFSFGRIFSQVAMSIMQGSGNMVGPMWTQLIGAVTNLILDPILIFGLLGFPALGITGAAIATVTGQILAMLFTFVLMFKSKNSTSVHMDLKHFKYKGETMKQIFVVGLPAMIMQGLSSVMIAGFNLILTGYTTTAVAVLGAYFKVQSVIFMPIFGLSQGLMPIMGYNYGARNKKRIMDALKFGTFVALVIMLIGTLIMQLFPAQLLALFNPSDQLLEIGIVAFKTISLGFMLAAISIVISTLFQAIGDAYLSMIISFIRQLIILLPSAYFLGKIGGLDAIWMSFPMAEVVGLIATLLFFRKVYKNKIETMPEKGQSE